MNDSLGDRMKKYESSQRTRLVSHVPVMGRLDGKAFHTFTRGLQKPYDERFQQCMWDAALYLCEHIQGARVGYVQSDEISILVTQKTDFDQGWFEFDVQKMASISASWAGAVFLRSFLKHFPEESEKKLAKSLPAFDARFWNVPAHEVCNVFIWRQNDAKRNSIMGLAQAHFSHKRLHGVSGNQAQEILMTERGINWNDCPTPQKRGVCIVKVPYIGPGNAQRTRWEVDREIPIFTQNRNYIERLLRKNEESRVDIGTENQGSAGQAVDAG